MISHLLYPRNMGDNMGGAALRPYFMTLVWGVVSLSCWSFAAPPPVAEPPSAPPSVEVRLKPREFKALVEDKEVVVHAKLEDQAKLQDQAGKDHKKYSFSAAMLVGASTAQTRKILTDYRLYSKMIPYVEKAELNPLTQVLQLEGGIWRFKLQSWLKFDERSERWIQFRIIGGHFQGLSGDILFDSLGERGTVVQLSGMQEGKRWPPKFVIERGAEIVFGFTAKRMRSYIESQKKADTRSSDSSSSKGEATHDPQLPQPRSRL